jgi:hypothetical protein
LLPIGKVTVNTVPVVWIESVTNDHIADGPKLVEIISFEAAPLNGHCRRKWEPSKKGLIKRGAPIPPTASATGKTLPLKSKNDDVL